MLRAFVQDRDDGMPFNANAYAAYDGFRERGIATEFFHSDDGAFWRALPDQADDLVFAAGNGTVHRILDVWGVAALLAGLPRFARASLRTAGLADHLRGDSGEPVAPKGVNGHVVSDFAGLPQTAGLPDDTPVYASEPIAFAAEWRVFVLEGEILDVRLYKGSRFLAPDEVRVRAMVAALAGAGEAPFQRSGSTLGGSKAKEPAWSRSTRATRLGRTDWLRLS